MSDIKNQLIRLGNTNPDLREHIRPVLEHVTSAPLMPSPLEDVTWKELTYAINSLRNTYQEYHGSDRPNKNKRQLVIDAQEAISILKDIQEG